MTGRLIINSAAVVFGASGSSQTDAAQPVLRLDASGFTVSRNKVLKIDRDSVLSIPQAPDVFGTLTGFLNNPVADSVIDASYSMGQIPFSKFDASTPLPVELGGIGVANPEAGAALVGNGTGPLESVSEIRAEPGSGGSGGSGGSPASLAIAGGIRLAEVDGQGVPTGASYILSSAEDGWGRPALLLERPGGDKVDLSSPHRSIGPAVTSLVVESVSGGARVYGAYFDANRPSRVSLAAFASTSASVSEVTPMRVVAAYRAVSSAGRDVSAEHPVDGPSAGSGLYRSAYYITQAIVIPQGFQGTVACAVSDHWGNLSPVYEIGA